MNAFKDKENKPASNQC